MSLLKPPSTLYSEKIGPYENPDVPHSLVSLLSTVSVETQEQRELTGHPQEDILVLQEGPWAYPAHEKSPVWKG